MTELYPYLLEPAYKDYIWGGSRIPQLYNRNLPDGVYAESWEISDRPEGSSVIKNGPLKGKTLAEAIGLKGCDIVGTKAHGAAMPLLIKLIDAAQNLSVQVHPHDSNAHLTGGEPKTEMWYVIDATDDARIYAGLKEGTTPESFRAAIHDKSLENVLHSFKPRKGDVFFIPGGRVHAIGAGCLLLEVQQNSNTTYRVYDWGRVDAEGNSRPLHVDQALQVINWHDADSPLHAPARSISTDTAEILSLLDTEWFSLLRLDLLGEHAITGDGSSFKALFVESGSAFVRTNEGDTLCQTGQSCLVPAAIQSWSLVPDSDETRILIASV